MTEPFLGQIQAFGFNFAPRGWAKCDGQLLPIAQNSALFSLLGTMYGGDGETTFGLPDLRGRSMYHEGTGPGLSPFRIGEKGGAERETLTVQNMPSHGHTFAVPAVAAPANQSDPGGHAFAEGNYYQNGPATETLRADGTSLVGGGQSFSIRSPYLVINVCIALTGVYPSRSDD